MAKLERFDVSGHLDNGEMIAGYLTQALLTNDLETPMRAIGAAAKAGGMTRSALPTVDLPSSAARLVTKS